MADIVYKLSSSTGTRHGIGEAATQPDSEASQSSVICGCEATKLDVSRKLQVASTAQAQQSRSSTKAASNRHRGLRISAPPESWVPQILIRRAGGTVATVRNKPVPLTLESQFNPCDRGGLLNGARGEGGYPSDSKRRFKTW